jgi:hypothetical protein
MHHPIFSRSKTMAGISEGQDLPASIATMPPAHGGLRATETPEHPRVRVSSLPAFAQVLQSTTDAAFFLAWNGVIDECKQLYPGSELLQDPISGKHLQRYIDLFAARDANNNALWTVEKAEREIAAQSRKSKSKRRGGQSTLPSETPAYKFNEITLLADQCVPQNDSPLLDMSWMEDSTVILGLATASSSLNKKKKKRKVKQAGKRLATYESQQRTMSIDDKQRREEIEQLTDPESVASEVDDMTLAEAKLGATLKRQLSLDEVAIEATEVSAVCPKYRRAAYETTKT